MYQMILRFPMELKDIIKQEATKKGLTLTSMIKQILWEWAEAKQKATG